MADDSRIPRVIVDSAGLRALPLAPVDGFILSRIDGRATERALSGLTGLPESQVRSTLDKLVGLKVITFSPVGALPEAEATPAEAAPQRGSNALLTSAIAGVPDDAPELAEAVDMPLELRRRILGLHSVATSLDHYALLGVERDADKKAVKRAYFELAALFHPDRYFRKNLGSFKVKMESIFAKVTVAYETLSNKDQRAEYDVYLGDVERSQAVETMLRNVMSEVETAEQSVVEEVGPVDDAAGQAANGPPSVRPSTLPRSASDQLRREALAMRLKGGARRPPARAPVQHHSSLPPKSISPESASQAMDTLRARYEQRVDASRRHQSDKYLQLGQLAEGKNDLTAAAAAYRVALTFLREGEPMYEHAQLVIEKSDAQLAEIYVRQGHHEERNHRWEDACRSWTRAAKLRPNDAVVLERAANAMSKVGGDLHEAAQLAQRAATLDPNNAAYRCTLATVYAAAGLLRNAKRELEAAATLAPQDANIQALLKKLSAPAT